MKYKYTLFMILICNFEALIIGLVLLAYNFSIWCLPCLITNLIIVLILFIRNLWNN